MRLFFNSLLKSMETYQAQVGAGSIKNPAELMKVNEAFTSWTENLRETLAAIPSLTEIEDTVKLLDQLSTMLENRLKSVHKANQIGAILGMNFDSASDIVKYTDAIKKEYSNIERLRISFCKLATVLQPMEAMI